MINNLVKFVLDRGGSIMPLKISAESTEGTGICNPSIFIDGDQILCNIRHVEYALYHCENNQKYQKYKLAANNLKNVHFGGRLAEYKYYDMHQVIESALNFVKKEVNA